MKYDFVLFDFVTGVSWLTYKPDRLINYIYRVVPILFVVII